MGGVILAISAETASEQVRPGDDLATGLLFVPDPERRIIGLYGVEHVTMGREVARPAIFVLAPDGRVHWQHQTGNWRHRPSAESVLAAARAAAGVGAAP